MIRRHIAEDKRGIRPALPQQLLKLPVESRRPQAREPLTQTGRPMPQSPFGLECHIKAPARINLIRGDAGMMPSS